MHFQELYGFVFNEFQEMLLQNSTQAMVEARRASNKRVTLISFISHLFIKEKGDFHFIHLSFIHQTKG